MFPAMASAYVVLTTMPQRSKALALGRTLVEEKLAACVNVLGEVESIYRWQGAVHFDKEVLCLVKTTARRLEALKARIAELHPYDVPEIVALPISSGHIPYLSWLTESVNAKRRAP
jgi:periplasmic divalent cation tolerance protein